MYVVPCSGDVFSNTLVQGFVAPRRLDLEEIIPGQEDIGIARHSESSILRLFPGLLDITKDRTPLRVEVEENLVAPHVQLLRQESDRRADGDNRRQDRDCRSLIDSVRIQDTGCDKDHWGHYDISGNDMPEPLFS